LRRGGVFRAITSILADATLKRYVLSKIKKIYVSLYDQLTFI